MGDLLRLQLNPHLPATDVPSGSSEVTLTWAAADVERLLAGGQALAELVPWAASASNASKQISLALSKLKEAAKKSMAIQTAAVGARPEAPQAHPAAHDDTDSSGDSSTGQRMLSESGDLVARSSFQFASWCLRLIDQKQQQQSAAQPLPPLTQEALAELDAQGESSLIICA